MEGFYTIGEQSYIEGRHATSLLTELVDCDVYIEEEDDEGEEIGWVPGTIISICDGGANVNGNEPSWELTYLIGDDIREGVVPADRLRLLATSSGEPILTRDDAVNEETGIGGWKTVSEIIVDDDEIARARALEMEAALAATADVPLQRDDLHGDGDIQGAFDPNNKNVYRGISIASSWQHGQDQDQDKDDESRKRVLPVHDGSRIANGAIFSFKKKKKTSTMQNIRKKKNDE